MTTTTMLTTFAALIAGTALALPAEAQPRPPRVPVTGAPTQVKPLKPMLTPKQIQTLRSVQVEQVTGTVNLKQAKPELVLEHQVRNTSAKALTLQLGAKDVRGRRIRIPARGKSAVSLRVPVKTRSVGNKVRAFQVSPQLLVDSQQAFSSTRSFSIDVRLPSAAKKIIKSNKPLRALGRQQGDLVYQWRGKDQFMTTLSVWWTTSDIDVELQKTVNVNRRTRVAVVTVTVTNKGRTPARGVTLSENFAAHEVSAVARGSSGRFRVERGQVNDHRLLWSHSLPTLAPGGRRVVTYRLKAAPRTPDLRLYETVAEAGGEPVALSNPVVAQLR